jgi:small subunit ribosomal protein S9
MADEPQDNETSQDQPENTPAEGSDAQAAGPGADEGTSSSQAAGDDPSSTPPAGEASGEQPQVDASEEAPQDDAPGEEPAESPVAEQEEAEGAPAAEQEEAEPEPAEEPKVEKKKDAIPGADLEPIAVESDERPLSAEEKARKEAEAEERARREAALAGDSDEEGQTASRAPAKMESDSRYLATGKRKRSIARVTLLPGSGKIEINGRPIEEFFPRPLHQTTARQPLVTTGYEGSVDVRARVHGGGVSGQAGAVRHGISRALIEVDADLRGELKRRGFLTRDARAKERRKAGFKKARKRPQFSKR